MKFLAFIASLLIFAAPVLADNAPVPDGKPHQFTLHDGQFWVDGTPIRILAGEMHPGRIRPEFWDQRIKQAKAMGLNTISIYLFWNQIEPTEGNFVFKDQTDIRHFAQLCQDNGRWLIVRAGPYVCAEIEFGGFPAWLLKHPGLQIRTNEPQYMGYCKTYIQQIGGQLADMQVGHGGPIIMVQVENELHRIDDYLRALKDDFVAAGFDGQLMTCDPSGQPWTTVEGIPNVLRGYNGFSNDNSFAMRYNQITAVDKQSQSLPFDFLKADFAKDDLPLSNLDGILMANSFHYIRDKAKLIKKLETYFSTNPTFLIVEYNTTRFNPWVPYPINYEKLYQLFTNLGYNTINKLNELPSRFGGRMYSALIRL